MLRVEIIDDDCGEDEAHIFRVPLDTSKEDIMTAINVFFPTTRCIFMEVED